jgi:hypothetical protein
MTDQTDQPFEVPTGQAAAQGEETAATQQFTEPPSGAAEGEQAAFALDATALTAGFPSQLLDAHGAIAEALKGQARSGVSTASLEERGEIESIEGVGLGLGEPDGGPPGQPTLNVFVSERLTPETVREALVDGFGATAAGDAPLSVRYSGKFEALAFDFKIRPAPGGVSVGHYRVTAGTLGCLAIGRNPPRNSRLLCLSNNHVLANENNAVFGDCISQPGTYDYGGNYTSAACGPHQIAILERFVPLQFGGGVNYVDAATGWCWPDRVRRELLYRYGGGLYLYRIGSNPQYATLGRLVGKSGRTTELTQGLVVTVNWSGWVGYRSGSAYFVGQTVVQDRGYDFSRPGDSGSVIWNWESGLPPVGLLFAGGGDYTIANPMPWVTYFLDINLYT